VRLYIPHEGVTQLVVSIVEMGRYGRPQFSRALNV